MLFSVSLSVSLTLSLILSLSLFQVGYCGVECFKKHRMDGGHKASCAKSSSKQGGLLLHRFHFSPKGRNPKKTNGFNNEGSGTAKTVSVGDEGEGTGEKRVVGAGVEGVVSEVSEENGDMEGERHGHERAHGTQEVHTAAILLGREDTGDGGGAGRRLTV